MAQKENAYLILWHGHNKGQKWQAPNRSIRFPGGSDDKESACNAGDPGSIPGLRRSPGEGKGNPLQYSCLKNPMDGGTWQTTVHGGHKESIMAESLHLTRA